MPEKMPIARDQEGGRLSEEELVMLMFEAESHLRGALVVLDTAEKHCSSSFLNAYAAVMASMTALEVFTTTKKMLRNVPSMYYSKVYCSLVRKVFSAAANNWASACAEHPTINDKMPMSRPTCPSFYRDELSGKIKVGVTYRDTPSPTKEASNSEGSVVGNALSIVSTVADMGAVVLRFID